MHQGHTLDSISTPTAGLANTADAKTTNGTTTESRRDYGALKHLTPVCFQTLKYEEIGDNTRMNPTR